MKNRPTALLLLLLLTAVANARTVRILSIGNSFSRDAVEQNLADLAFATADTAIIGNLFIGGCSLERHANNIRTDSHDYVYRKIDATGQRSEFKNYSITQALADDKWDYVSLQQASPFSGMREKYEPYMTEIVKYVKRNTPSKPQIILHQTWAYQKGASNTGFKNYGNSQDSMYRAIVDAYANAARRHKIKIIVPAGTAIQNARTSFLGDRLNRDGYHLDMAHGRFTAACAWYETLFGKDVTANPFIPAGMDADVAKVSKLAAHHAVAAPATVTDLSQYIPAIKPHLNPALPIEIRIDNLLAQMTLDEKIMQLNQYTLGRNNNSNNVGEIVGELPAEIGSLIYFGDTPALRNAMQRRAVEESRLGIPIIFGYDAIHGFRTVYPISLGQACSFNPALVEKACAISARECRQSGVDWTFSPMIDVARDPRWGRVAEGYGEDPYLNAVMCAASVKGYQGLSLADSTSVAACLKHYVGYSASEAGRDYVYTEISPQTLWDTYLPPYEAGVKAGAVTLMSSFNDISGVPGSANRYTLTEILKDRWGHRGFVVSDWGAIEQLRSQGRAADMIQAAEAAFNAGLEMDMMSHAYDRHLADLVAQGKVSEDAVDEAVRRVLRVKFQLGLFENPYTPDVPDRFLRPADRQTVRQLAAETMVLLKNDSTATLPLNFAGKKIAVVGPLADNQWDLLGNWLGRGRASEVVSIFEGLKSQFGSDCQLRFAQGCTLDSINPASLREAVDAAKWADVVVLCLGEKLRWSGENASRSSIALPAVQEQLAAEIAKAGKPVVLLVVSGRPVELTRLEPLANAIVEVWQPGIEGGNAVADILSGAVNPSGKLAMTFPYSTGQIPIYYNRRYSARRHQGLYQDITSEPLYSFGHGLSYTTFEYGPIKLSKTEITGKQKLKASVEVTNTGHVAGAETVMWFIQDPAATITRPCRELKHFEKRILEPGQSAIFEFEISPRRDLSYPDASGKTIIEPGQFNIFVADKSATITLTE